jgi:thymidylate kinase
MLIKLNPIFSTYARHREEKIERALTRRQWIIADRILMAVLFVSVIILAIAFS